MTAPLDATTRYLCIEPFLDSVFTCRALTTAFEFGLIDLLENRDRVDLNEVYDLRLAIPAGLTMLLAFLQQAGVIERGGGEIALTLPFRQALEFRDLLRVKLEFAHFAAHDFIDHFSAMIREPQAFMARSTMFRLFSYDRCFELTPENFQHTRRWVTVTSTLTRYEAPVCFAHFGLAGFRRMMDIGGNSGEFVLRACRVYPALQATVFDLPVVCEVGRQHVAREPEQARIRFQPGNALADVLPAGHDLVSFKSVLHDWPEREALQLLGRAVAALESGGTLLIYERTGIDFDQLPVNYGTIPLLLFFHTYREATFYTAALSSLGMMDIQVRRIELEMPFWLITARKP